MNISTAKASQSAEVNSRRSERDTLRNEIATKRSRQEHFDDLYRWLTIATVIVAGILGAGAWICSQIAANAGKDAAPLEKRRDTVEDRISELLDQISKEEIAEAHKEAGIAHQAAGEADVKAATANKRAGELEVEAEQIKQANFETEKKLSSANFEIARLNTQRDALERSLYPRILFSGFGFGIPGVGSNPIFDRLRPFSKVKVAFRYVPDAECQRATHQIREILQAARWDLLPETPDSTLNSVYWDGVQVAYPAVSVENIPGESPQKRLERTRHEDERVGKLKLAAEELAAYLREMGWQAEARWEQKSSEIPYDAVEVIVGFKPLPYFDPSAIKQMHEKVNEIQTNQLNEDRKGDGHPH